MRAGHRALTNATVTVKAFDPFNISVGKHELQVRVVVLVSLPDTQLWSAQQPSPCS